MCLTVCLAAGLVQPSIPWARENPAFNSGPLESFDEGIRSRFSLPHVFSLRAHTGCACGFLRDGAEGDEDVQRSREALTAYVAAARAHGSAELYVCWNGDPEPEDLPRLELYPVELLTREDWLEEGRFTVVRTPTA